LSCIRVLHVIPSVDIEDGGPSMAIALMEAALADEGVSVTTLTTSRNTGSFDLNENFAPADRIGALRVYAQRWTKLYKFAPGLTVYLTRHVRSFDLVHIHALFSFSSTIAAWIARMQGVPYIIRPLGTLSNYGVRHRRRRLKSLSLLVIEGPIVRAAAAVHFTSHTEMEEAKSLGLDFKGAIIPNGIDQVTTDAKTDIRNSYPALLGRHVILFLSRVDPKKNLEALIDAVKVLDSHRPECALIVAGNGNKEYVDDLKHRAEEAGIGDRVVWLGHVGGSAKASVFACADVYVLPSYSENFGIAAVEAMLAGVPCVLTPGVAIGRETASAGAAVLSEPSPHALASAIESLLSNKINRRAIGERGREFAIEAYSTKAMALRLVALYENILRSRKERVA
jgi:glycosyltransferase involved in cell wall biosynthesis